MTSTLLLADDSVTIRRVIELTFANEDIRVITAGDGETAIQRIDAESPDIVLADVAMPKLDGYAVSAHVKNAPRLRSIPVLLLTGAFDPIDEDKARACGCDGILVKPFEPQQLIGRVKELLAGRSHVLVPPPAPAELPEPMGLDRDQETTLDAGRPVHFSRSNDEPDEAEPPLGEWDLPDPPAQAADFTPGGHASAQSFEMPARMAPGPTAKISIANAFSALLAAEQAHLPPARPAPAPVAISDSMVQEIVNRVLARLNDDVVRRIVFETAECLVREETEKMKQTD
jgi:CheY-like chemotaxis protein